MEISKNPGEACLPDAFEGETRNDIFTNPARDIPTDIDLLASLCLDDVDYYALTLEANQALKAQIDFDGAQSDFDLALIDPASGAILVESVGLLGLERVFLRTPFEREVLVRVRAFDRSAGAYQMRFEILPAFVCEEDAFEPDNSVENATLLTEAITQERTLCTNDVDVFEVNLLDFQRVVARANFDAAEFDLELTLENEAGEILEVSPNSSEGETLSYSSPIDQRAYLFARARNNSQGAYRLSLGLENQIDCVADEFEPNNILAEASPYLEAVSGLTLCGDDEDLFSFEATAGQRLTISISFNHGDGDIDLMLLGLDGAQVLSVSDGRSNGEIVSAVIPADGVYTARVFSLNEDVRSRYSIEATLD